MNIPRPEYPRPQLTREAWINLNGEWSFEIDYAKSGRGNGLPTAETLASKILVPFCPESRLSGVAHTDFMPAVWYTRTVDFPAEWTESGRVILHFGAVDYAAEVWVNGNSAGTYRKPYEVGDAYRNLGTKTVPTHEGGYSPFELDITKFLIPGENRITVCAEDDVRSAAQPAGKQSRDPHSFGCSYTRTTGIWQTVWAEHVPDTYIRALRILPDVANERVSVEVLLGGASAEGISVSAEASYEGTAVSSASAKTHWRSASLVLPIADPKLWEPGCGRLYDLKLELSQNGVVTDAVGSYFGMRDVDLDGKAIRINGKAVFQRLVLDQGFNPDGIYTAPTDDELKADIERSMAMGFNGARLHQKVFEPRFLYWADRLGYLCWDEHANWELDISGDAALYRFLPEWEEIVERDYSHPSIIGWCPFNETQMNQHDGVLRAVYAATKRLNPSRPIIDSSGWHHVITDVFDTHDYEQNVELFGANHERINNGECPNGVHVSERAWTGEIPYFVSEFGGARWADESDRAGWGYGNDPQTVEEFIARYDGLVTALLENPRVCAFCYTQLTDVEQERNGLYTYDRRPKFDPAAIRACNQKIAAIER